MPIFRINKTANYTVMSNYHLRERGMSLKAKGLLSLILSLPEDWDYSVAGLATLSKEGKGATLAAVQELERFGYVRRTQAKGEGGRFAGYDYEVFEEPQAPDEGARPLPENRSTGNPSAGKPAQITKEGPSTEEGSTYSSDRTDKGDREGASPSDPVESLKKILRESPEASAWVNGIIGEAVDNDIRARLSRLGGEDQRGTKPSAFTRRLIKAGYISEGDLEIGDYNLLLAGLVDECGDWTLVKNAVNYFVKTCRGDMREGITDRLAYFSAAVRQGVERQMMDARNAERQEAFLAELERMRARAGEGVQS